MAVGSSSSCLLVVNADDFGYCEERNRGIIESFQDGIVSSASLPVNAENASEAIKLSKKYGVPLGLHLNLTEGRPIKTHYKSLTSKKCLLKGKFGFREALKNGEIDLDEVKQEIQAQLQWFVNNTGSLPTHIDGHQHVHVIPKVCDILAGIMKKSGIYWTRLPVQKHLNDCLWLDEQRKSFFRSVEKDAQIAKETFSRCGMRFTDYFIGYSTMGKDIKLHLQEALENVFMQINLTEVKPCSSCELMVHPGYKSIVGCGGCGEGPDVFACSEEREHELETLKSPQLKEFLKANNITLCSFKDL